MQPRGCKVSEGREIPGSLWRSPEPAPSAMHGLLRGSQLGFVPVLPALEILRLLGAVGTPERVDAEGRERRKERRGERTGLTCATAFTRLPLLLAACSTENGQRQPKRGSEALSSWTATHFPAGVWITPNWDQGPLALLWCWQDSPAWVSPCYPGLEGHSHGQSWHLPLPPPRDPPALSLLMAPGVTSLPPALAQLGLPLPVPVQPHTLSDAPALHSSSCKVEKQERSLWCPILTNSACTEKPQQPCVPCV